ncbi:hypothetical protein TPHA_0B01640 [Tetrapisispora phaffii CBS 4417]|uniref:Phosphotransferase n=1 Tax=Tetrapisispora phaffii (strain ATCC 24235 / CBS 4417 / NBRC 1672 / NRRL Y-8282 / UCD 70-5) TaxID=1071381 RepID=G8BPA7_TETPH|nr:hypothetical protein TPHA_0B01640 [Tetrapisispora phaffii CBS 4417]CCE61838.1 hypothetical protein TPHA_0B01640 [Tetrapisispora phaffii CBS 4417]
MTVNSRIVGEVRKKFIPKDDAAELKVKFLAELEWRLQNSKYSMLPSRLVHGSIKAPNSNNRYISIDFGGTTLKIAIMKYDSDEKNFEIAYQNSMNITSKIVDWKFFEELVFWICQQLNEQCDFSNELTFLISTTFSSPLDDNNKIVSMGKGFELMDELKDISLNAILKKLFNKYKSNNIAFTNARFQICDIINDSVAVYITGKFTCLKSQIALILGTGLNSCFELPNFMLPEYKAQHYDIETSQKVIINAEAGFLGKDFIKLSRFEKGFELDNLNMPMEFITSGKYIPSSFLRLLTYYNIPISKEIEFDGSTFGAIINGNSNITSSEFKNVCRELALLYLERASIYLVAMLEGILELTNNSTTVESDTVNIGYVGSFLANIEEYRNMVEIRSGHKFKLIFLEDSNLKGATIATCTNIRHHWI